MISTRPYLLRAIYQWAIDSDLTPQLLVNASYPGVIVPQGYINDGHVVLNVHDRAVKGLMMENEYVSFSARFGGQSHYIELPIMAIEAIYTRENEKGMFFQPEQAEEPKPSNESGHKITKVDRNNSATLSKSTTDKGVAATVSSSVKQQPTSTKNIKAAPALKMSDTAQNKNSNSKSVSKDSQNKDDKGSHLKLIK